MMIVQVFTTEAMVKRGLLMMKCCRTWKIWLIVMGRFILVLVCVSHQSRGQKQKIRHILYKGAAGYVKERRLTITQNAGVANVFLEERRCLFATHGTPIESAFSLTSWRNIRVSVQVSSIYIIN